MLAKFDSIAQGHPPPDDPCLLGARMQIMPGALDSAQDAGKEVRQGLVAIER